MRRLILALSLLALAPSAFAQQRFAPPKVSTLTGLLGNQGDIVNLVGTGDYLCFATTCTTATDWKLITSGSSAATFTTLTANAFIGNGTIPAVSNTSANSCGTDAATMAANSTNTAGAFTVGATAGTSCTLTFTTAAPHFWVCAGSDESGTPAAVPWVRIGTTTGKFVGTFVAADVINYVCAAY